MLGEDVAFVSSSPCMDLGAALQGLFQDLLLDFQSRIYLPHVVTPGCPTKDFEELQHDSPIIGAPAI